MDGTDTGTSSGPHLPARQLIEGSVAAIAEVEKAAEDVRQLAETLEALFQAAVDDIAGGRQRASGAASDIISASGRLTGADGDDGRDGSVQRLREALARFRQFTRGIDGAAHRVANVVDGLQNAIDQVPEAAGVLSRAKQSVVRDTLQPALTGADSAIRKADTVEVALDALARQASRFGWLHRLASRMGGRANHGPAALHAQIRDALKAVAKQLAQSRDVAIETIDVADSLDAHRAELEQAIDSIRMLLSGGDAEACQAILTLCGDLDESAALVQDRLRAVDEDHGRSRAAAVELGGMGRQLMGFGQELGRVEYGLRRHRGNLNAVAGNAAALRERITASKGGNRVAAEPTGQIAEIDSNQVGIVDLGADISRDLRLHIERNILTNGEPFGSGGVLVVRFLD